MDLTAASILEIGALLLLAAVAGWGARRVGLPAILGYLAVGLLVSPFTPGYVADREQLQLLADLGVVLLLFEVGIEIDLGRIRREERRLLWAAPLQATLTLAISAGALALAGLDPLAAATVGLAVALSSSVVIVNMTRSRRRTTDPPTEHALLGWSVVQDVVGVTIAAVLLAMLGVSGRPLAETAAGLIAYTVVAVVVAAALPRILRLFRGEPDLFLLVSVSAGLVVAGVGSAVFGVPLALAAFVAGLAISEGRETAEARRRLIPFRDLFAVLFFVTIGTLVDPGRLVGPGLGWLALLLALVVLAKVVVVWAIARLAGLRARPAQLAIGLGQMGEFSFVLAAAAATAGAISQDLYVAIIAAVAVTVAASTVLVRAAGPSGARPMAEPA
ncbi:MAG: cation:proton antiporter [Chloroflexi bacterium]|nr:cation:proton antiporter [Chloroflexota bacterium]